MMRSHWNEHKKATAHSRLHQADSAGLKLFLDVPPFLKVVEPTCQHQSSMSSPLISRPLLAPSASPSTLKLPQWIYMQEVRARHFLFLQLLSVCFVHRYQSSATLQSQIKIDFYLRQVGVERTIGRVEDMLKHEGDRCEDEPILILNRRNRKLTNFLIRWKPLFSQCGILTVVSHPWWHFTISDCL